MNHNNQTTPYEELCEKRDEWYFVSTFGQCRDNEIAIFQEFFSAYERLAQAGEPIDACFARLRGNFFSQIIRESSLSEPDAPQL